MSTRSEVYKLIVEANSDAAFGRAWDVEKFIDGIEAIYSPKESDG